MTPLVDVAAVVVSWRTPDLTRGLLAHLADHWPDLEVFLVECGPESHAPYSPQVTVLRAGNLGYAGGNDLGIRAALAIGKKHVLVVNSDALPLPGSIEELVAVLDSDPQIAACGATLVRWTAIGIEVNAGTSFDWQSGDTAPQAAQDPASPVGFACGAVVLLRGETLRKVGGFDANLFLYYEDLDWSERARAAGASVHVSRRAIALHTGSVSTGGAAKAGAYYRARNRLWMLRRYGPSHGQRLSTKREAARIVRVLGRSLLSGELQLLAPQAIGTAHGLVMRPPDATDEPTAALGHQRWEARDTQSHRATRGNRLTAWTRQPEVQAAPIRALGRRLVYEVARRARPSALARERLVELDGSLRIWVRPADDIERSILLLGTYDHAAVRAFTRLAPSGGVAVDIGAHVGQFTLLGARAVGATGRVLAFEPQPRIFHRLQRNVAENGLANVDAYPLALGSRTSVVRLHPTESDSNSGLASVCTAGDGCESRHQEVRCVRLDDVVHDAGIDHIDILKIDVEGFEQDVLHGAAEVINRSRPAIIIEANEVEATDDPPSSAAIAQLVELGYQLFGIGPADGEAPHLHRLQTGRQVHMLRQQGRPINLVALHERWRGYDRAMRWVVASRPREVSG